MKPIVFNKNEFKEIVKQVGFRRYYVYVFYKQINDEPFYVGRGCGYRATNVSSRSKKTKDILRNEITYMKLHKHTLSLNESCEVEIELIKEIGLSNLTNVSIGGEEGAQGENNYFYGVHLYGELNGNYNNRNSDNPLSIPILCLDFNGNIIKEYNSLIETELDNFSSSIVSKCCKGKRIQHKGYQFIYKSNYIEKFDYTFIRSTTSKIEINSYDLNDKFIKSYKSIQDTSIDGFSPKNVQQVLKGKKKSHKNHFFKYKTIQDIV